MKFLIPLCLGAVATLGEALELRHELLPFSLNPPCQHNSECLSKVCCVDKCSIGSITCEAFRTDLASAPGVWKNNFDKYYKG